MESNHAKICKVWPPVERTPLKYHAGSLAAGEIDFGDPGTKSTVHGLESPFTSSSIRSSSRSIFVSKSHLISSLFTLDGTCEVFDAILVECLLRGRLIPCDVIGIVRSQQTANVLA
jgi:hypothetical protein